MNIVLDRDDGGALARRAIGSDQIGQVIFVPDELWGEYEQATIIRAALLTRFEDMQVQQQTQRMEELRRAQQRVDSLRAELGLGDGQQVRNAIEGDDAPEIRPLPQVRTGAVTQSCSECGSTARGIHANSCSKFDPRSETDAGFGGGGRLDMDSGVSAAEFQDELRDLRTINAAKRKQREASR